ncbi:phage tail protein [Nitratifractor salsuginis DSM 16511]|uniref:Phage tail protein n=2 Tax=Nitratifractor salsuginis TaxID=269261 RepID=E6X1M3_NITSE|nr:phage tail protein [Nitratifractor salsuginis DSM 16511]
MDVFGTVDYTEKILRLNPETHKMPIIPAGTLLKLPEREEKQAKGVNLWS